jgi:hypothetical protein
MQPILIGFGTIVSDVTADIAAMSTPATFAGQDATDVFNAFSAVRNILYIAIVSYQRTDWAMGTVHYRSPTAPIHFDRQSWPLQRNPVYWRASG